MGTKQWPRIWLFLELHVAYIGNTHSVVKLGCGGIGVDDAGNLGKP